MTDKETQKKPKGAGKSSFELIETRKLTETVTVTQGMCILDLACGMGAYTRYFSDRVGEKGLVYAVDLWKEGLDMLQNSIDEKNITNILPLHADAAQPIDIDAHSLDICLMATVLHDFQEAGQADPVLKQVKSLLKPHGTLAVIEFKKIDGPPGPPIHIRMSENDVEEMVIRYGFKKDKAEDIGPYNYIMTFKSIE